MHRQAIVTKYIVPTSLRDARAKAFTAAHTLNSVWDPGRSNTANYAAAAKALATSRGWTGSWVSGGMPDGSGDVFVWCEDPARPAFVVEA